MGKAIAIALVCAALIGCSSGGMGAVTDATPAEIAAGCEPWPVAATEHGGERVSTYGTVTYADDTGVEIEGAVWCDAPVAAVGDTVSVVGVVDCASVALVDCDRI
jgi:hypothetical protein